MTRSVTLAGSGDFDFDVVGESFNQDAFDQICGGKCEEGHQHRLAVLLLHDDDNKHDPNAVAVYAGTGQKLAYLSREDAIDFRGDMATAGHAGVPALCGAMIIGGWKRGGRGEGHYGLKLDLEWPIEIAERNGGDEVTSQAGKAGCLGSLVAVVGLALILALIPNNEAAWVQDLGFDACRAVSGHDDWRCE